MVIGKMQLQQMSVIGFTKRPWQVESARAGGARTSHAMTSTAAKRRLEDFIDAKALAFLGDERRYVADPEFLG
jgi:hypothetical protein